MSTPADIHTSYDVSNEFFAAWLDTRMLYSCALFDPGDSLEDAQVRKLEWACDAARVGPASELLEIGCGWGATLEHATRQRGARRAVGLTLSRAQYQYVLDRDLPRVSVVCASYLGFEPEKPFDALISIGMFEHLATPEEARSGQSREIYRNYFHRAWCWSQPGTRFALQTIVSERLPRDRSHVRELSWGSRTIFPGAQTPRLEDVAAGASPFWEIREIQMRGEHYARTSAEWHRRLRANEEVLTERFGRERFESYDRYLRTCVMCFENGYQSLARLVLERVDRKRDRSQSR